MTTSARLAGAVSAGLVPAIVAFVVLLFVDGDVDSALLTAAIIWIGLSVLMWFRFGRRETL